MVPELRLFWIPSHGICDITSHEQIDIRRQFNFSSFFNPARHPASRVFLFFRHTTPMNTTPQVIEGELQRIESAHGVRILFAAESGSRAWGFASRDSDFDVRFIYARDPDWYLSVDVGRDVIEEKPDAELDLVGWDIRKALQLLRKSNPSLLEWIKSAIVYRADPVFALTFGLLASEFYSPARGFRHYLSMAKSDLPADTEPREPLKKILYVLRALLAAQWIERGLGPVPIRFQTLVDMLVQDPLIRIQIAVLVARKRAGEEVADAQRIPVLDGFVQRELGRLEKISPVEPAMPDAENLNLVLRTFCDARAA